jgi:hypothetical protein
MWAKLKSRKLWVTIGGLGVVVLHQGFGVDPDKANAIVQAVSVIVGGYVLGQGYADGQAAKNR